MENRLLKKIIAILLSVMLVIGMVPAEAFAAGEGVQSTTAGEWTYDSQAETLTQGDVELKNVKAEGNELTLGGGCLNKEYNGTLDLTGKIKDEKGEIFSITGIGSGAFSRCSSLTGINIPDSVTSIGARAFSGCSSLIEIEIPDGVTVIEDGGPEDGGMFSYCKSLTKVKLPSNLKRIGVYAFFGCSSLEDIKLPPRLTSIGYGAFSYCSSLTEIEIPDGVTVLEDAYNEDDGAFSFCNNLIKVKLPSNLKSIGDRTFKRCSSLTGIQLPTNLTSIGSDAFSECSSLTEVNIPDSVTSIGDSAFSGCSSLTGIQLPTNLTSIGSDAFSECSSLTEITVPDGVQEITYGVFRNCENLLKVRLSSELKSIEGGAFSGCISLTDIELPTGVTDIGDAAFYGCSFTEINLSEGLQNIGAEAFRNTGLVKIKIPEGINAIEENTFAGCSQLADVEIPASMGIIRGDAFAGCRDLLVVTSKNETPPAARFDLFADSDKLKNIYVPEGSVEKYKQATGWKGFSEAIKPICDKPPVGEYPVLSNIGNIPDQRYTGNEIKPSVTVYDENGNVVDSEYYTVSYSNNINPGTATVTVTGINGATGSATTTFRIVEKSEAAIISHIAPISEQKYTGKEIRPAVTVYDTNGSVLSADRYNVTYFSNINPGIATVMVTGKNGTVGSAAAQFVITMDDAKEVSYITPILDQTYTGSAVRPSVSVYDKKGNLLSSVYYTATYYNNVNPGTATVIVTGRNGYTGSISTTFKIVEDKIVLSSAGYIEDQVYTGNEIRPSVTVYDTKGRVVSPLYYDVTYKDNIKPGTATVTVTAKNGASGTVTRSFRIYEETREIGKIAAIADQKYTGAQVRPSITVYDTSGKIIEPSAYSVSYSDNILPGIATVKVTGISGIKGSASAEFRILPPEPEVVKITDCSSDFGRIRVYFDKVDALGDNTMRYQIQSQKVGSDVVKTQYATVGYSYATVKNLAYNAKYNIRIRAYYVDENGERIYGDWSEVKSVYANRLGTSNQVMYKPAITKLTAGKTSVAVELKKVAFTKNPVKITYQIAYKKQGATKFSYAYTTNVKKTVYNLSKNTNYQFKVRYYYRSTVDDKLVFSPYTALKSVKTK